MVTVSHTLASSHVFSIFILFLAAVILRQLWAALKLALGRDKPA